MPLSLKAARVNCNLTQEEAAKKIGVTPKMLSDWENAKSFPSVKRLPAILSTYGVGYDDLIFLPRESTLSVSSEGAQEECTEEEKLEEETEWKSQ